MKSLDIQRLTISHFILFVCSIAVFKFDRNLNQNHLIYLNASGFANLAHLQKL